jgi:uncharacterized protein YecE (DUF72 family)
VRGILVDHGAALCWADRRGPRNPTGPEWATAPWSYVRFHGGLATPRGCYGERALGNWLERLCTNWPAETDQFLYWNNDYHGCAPRDAARFAALARGAGLDVGRTPEAASLPVG